MDFRDLDDDQLRSAIKNIGDPASDIRKGMLDEARRRWLDSLDFTRTCLQLDVWYYFFKEIDRPLWATVETCACGTFDILISYKDEQLCKMCMNKKYPGWERWWR